MKSTTPARRKPASVLLALMLCFVVTGCEYDVPVTKGSTRGVDERLLGDWIAMGGWMKVRRLDARGYVIFHDGKLYRAWHSGVAGLPLVSVHDFDSEKRKFAYLSYALSDDGRRLTLRVVNDQLIPDDTKDSNRVKTLFEEHARDPALFGEGFVYVRQ